MNILPVMSLVKYSRPYTHARVIVLFSCLHSCTTMINLHKLCNINSRSSHKIKSEGRNILYGKSEGHIIYTSLLLGIYMAKNPRGHIYPCKKNHLKMVPDCWVELDRVYAWWKCRFSPKAGRVSGMTHQTGPKKGPKGPSGMTHQTGPKLRRQKKNQKNFSRERGWGK